MAKSTKTDYVVPVAASVIVVALLVWQLFFPGLFSHLHVENVALVKKGMPQEEVESLLGGPPGDYSLNRSGKGMMTLEGVIAPKGSIEKVWFNDNRRFEVYFDAAGKVVLVHERANFETTPNRFSDLWKSFLDLFICL